MPEPTNGRRRHVHRLSQATPFTARGGKRCAAPRRVHPMLAEVLQARSHGHGRRLPAHTATTWVTGSTWYIPATRPRARNRTAARTSGDPFSTLANPSDWRTALRNCTPGRAPLNACVSRPFMDPSGSPAAPEPRGPCDPGHRSITQGKRRRDSLNWSDRLWTRPLVRGTGERSLLTKEQDRLPSPTVISLLPSPLDLCNAAPGDPALVQITYVWLTPCSAGERAASTLRGSDALETATGLQHFR